MKDVRFLSFTGDEEQVAAPRGGQSGMHSHRCFECGHVWWHADSPGNLNTARDHVEKHTCPRCGAFQGWSVPQYSASPIGGEIIKLISFTGEEPTVRPESEQEWLDRKVKKHDHRRSRQPVPGRKKLAMPRTVSGLETLDTDLYNLARSIGPRTDILAGEQMFGEEREERHLGKA
jgi:hypothetical protein